MGKTNIEWTDLTWNPVTGCDPVSLGCDHCYAKSMSKRFAGRKGWGPKEDPFAVTMHPERLEVKFPKKPKRIFVCSMADLFHPKVSSDFINAVIEVIYENPIHTFQILTKRPQRMLSECLRVPSVFAKLYPNLWLGVTAENQETANQRIPILSQIDAAIRFVSCEPLLGPIEFGSLINGLDWVIVGGETGPGARALQASWVDHIIIQCNHAGIPVFFKQWGSGTDYRSKQMLDIGPELKQFPKVKNA